MQFFLNVGQVFIDQDLKQARCDESGFALLTGFRASNAEWKNFAVEELGFMILSVVDHTVVAIFNRQHLNKKQACFLIEQFKRSKKNHFFLIEQNILYKNTINLLSTPMSEKHTYYKIHDLEGLSEAVRTLTYLFNNKSDISHDGKTLSFTDEDIGETDPYIKNVLNIYQQCNGYLNSKVLDIIKGNEDISVRSVLYDSDFKIMHFGSLVALNMGDAKLAKESIKNDVRNMEFKEYMRERMRVLSTAFIVEKPFYQHVDSFLDRDNFKLNLTYKIGIFPWKSPIGRIIHTVSNNRYNLQY